jgi:hypothetical protein
VKIAVQLEPQPTVSAEVQNTWDADTDILSAQVLQRAIGDGMSGSVGSRPRPCSLPRRILRSGTFISAWESVAPRVLFDLCAICYSMSTKRATFPVSGC